jgi:hypothetical protein
MSADGNLDALLELARAIDRGTALVQDETLPPQVLANNRSAYRATIAGYLSELATYLGNDPALTSEILKPLLIMAEQIKDLELRGLRPPLFVTEGRPFGMTKSSQRLAAEGHAVGCVAYLNEIVGNKLMFACNVVAALFSWLGHTGRITTRLHEPLAKTKLSAKTLYQWHTELEANEESAGLGEAIRQAAKRSAYYALLKADANKPIRDMCTEDARMELAQRIGHIAAKTRLGVPGEPKITLLAADSDNSETSL